MSLNGDQQMERTLVVCGPAAKQSRVMLVSSHSLDDQATKGVWRMPWGQEPKKDAAHSEMPGGAASTL